MQKQKKQPTKASEQHYLGKTACSAQTPQSHADIVDRMWRPVRSQRHRAHFANRILTTVKRHVATNGREAYATLEAKRGSTIVATATARVVKIAPSPWQKRIMCVAAVFSK